MSEEFKIIEPNKSYVKFSEAGDFVQGTLIGVSDFEGDYGKCKRYEVLVETTKFKDSELKKGDKSSFLGHFTMDEAMAELKVGQRFRVEFEGKVASKKRKGAEYNKYVVKAGPMNDEWLKSSDSDEAQIDEIFEEANK